MDVTMTFSDGKIWTGKFFPDGKHYGSVSFPNGTHYIGHLQDGYLHGLGSITTSTTITSGEYVRGKQKGFAKRVYPALPKPLQFPIPIPQEEDVPCVVAGVAAAIVVASVAAIHAMSALLERRIASVVTNTEFDLPQGGSWGQYWTIQNE